MAEEARTDSFASANCFVQDSPVHGRGIALYTMLNQLFIFKGVFACNKIRANQLLCTIPGIFVEDTKLKDVQREYILETKLKRDSKPIHFDSTCFSQCAVLPLGIGQFVNSSHPFDPDVKNRSPNAYYYERDNGLIDVVSLKNIEPGEEILVNYHWHLAVPRDGQDTTTTKSIGDKCRNCKQCVQTRKLYKEYQAEKNDDEPYSTIEASSSELQVCFIKNYLQVQQHESNAGTLNELSNTNEFEDCLTQYSISKIMMSLSDHTSIHGNSSFLQIGGGVGFEAFAAPFYGSFSASFFITNEDVQKAAHLRKAFEITRTMIREKNVSALLLIPDYRKIGSIFPAVNSSVVLISRELPTDVAAIVAVTAMNSTSQVIITFHQSVLQKVLSSSGEWHLVDTVECTTVSNVHDLFCCYVLFKRSYATARSFTEDIAAIQFWHEHQPSDTLYSKFNLESIQQYRDSRISLGIPHLSIRRRKRSHGKVDVDSPSLGASGEPECSQLNRDNIEQKSAVVPSSPLLKKPKVSPGFVDPCKQFVTKYINLGDSRSILKQDAAYNHAVCAKKMGFVNIESIFGISGNSNARFRASKSRWLKSNWYSEVNIEILCGIFRMIVKELTHSGKVAILPPSFFMNPEDSQVGILTRSWNRLYPDVALQDVSTLVCIMYQQSHFATLEVDLVEKRLVIHDSILEGETQRKWFPFVTEVREFISQAINESIEGWPVGTNHSMPQQSNSNDCGIFSAAASLLLLLRVPVVSWRTEFLPADALRLLFASMFLDVASYFNSTTLSGVPTTTGSGQSPFATTPCTEAENQSGYDAGASTAAGCGIRSTLSSRTSDDSGQETEKEIQHQCRHSSVSGF
jgi:hypothetical protein